MFSKSAAGAKIISVNGGVTVNSPYGSEMYKYRNGRTLQLTGNYTTVNVDYIPGVSYILYMQTTSGEWAAQYMNNSGQIATDYYWDIEPLAAAVLTSNTSSAKKRDAQSVLNKLIAANKRIIENNMICRRFGNRLTADECAMVTWLQDRVEQRNEDMQQSGLLQDVRVANPDKLTQYAASQYDIGSVTVTIIVAAVVVLATAVAAYYYYKGLLDEAEQDVKYSDKLTKTLTDKLTAEEYEQLKRETAGMITRKSLKARFSGGWTATKLFAFGALFLFTIPLLSKTKKEITKK